MPLPRDEFRIVVWERAAAIGPSGTADATITKIGECWMAVTPGGSSFNRWQPGLETMYDFVFICRNKPVNRTVLTVLSNHLTLPENLYFHVNDSRFAQYQDFVVKIERKRMASCMRHHRDYHEIYYGNYALPVPREIELDGADVDPVP
jgi:hypothetical protein